MEVACGATADPVARGTAGTLRRSAAGLRRSPVAMAGLCALAFALAVELAPVVGGDLVAQAWWTSWASSVGTPVDLGWFGGVPVASYSLLSPWIGAFLGLPLAGIVGTVLGAVCTTALLGLLRPSRLRWTVAGMCAAATWAADEWSGRTTFGLGAAVGALALVVVCRPAAGRGHAAGGAVLAAVAGALSPVASAFLLVAAAAWWCGAGRGSRPAAPWWLAAGALLPLAAARLLGAVSGTQPASVDQMVAALVAACLTGALVAPAHRVLRWGAAWTALLLLATWLISDPVGSNSTRLVLLFAAPVLVAAAAAEPVVTALAVVAVVALLPPLLPASFSTRSDAEVRARAAPLIDELGRRGPVGRIEVVPLADHEESRRLARSVPLARGWLRQLDTARAPLFYSGTLGAAGYLHWLADSGVSYVALPGGRLDFSGRREAALLRGGGSGLREVWSDGWWQLFEVPGGGLLRGNATLVSSSRSDVVVDVPRAGQVQVAVWWSQWSSVRGPDGCVSPGTADGWTVLTAHRPGRYVVTSAWRPTGRCG